uniref:Uncharacterized protein n=1 Tax=Rhizophora mucronata TaxID=61149 RepID=A0A2P2QS07_RHIMU
MGNNYGTEYLLHLISARIILAWRKELHQGLWLVAGVLESHQLHLLC